MEGRGDEICNVLILSGDRLVFCSVVFSIAILLSAVLRCNKTTTTTTLNKFTK